MAREFVKDFVDMEASTATTDGMLEIEGDLENLSAVLMPEDYVYAVKDGIELHLRMIYPMKYDIEETWPLYLHVQGSAWLEQNMCDHVMDLSPLAKAGYAVGIIQYRTVPNHIFPSQVEDAKDALRFVMEHAKEMRIDKDRIFFGGDSSGGHTALMCWATWKNHKLDAGKTDHLAKIRAFIDLYGVVDLAYFMEYPSMRIYDEGIRLEDFLLGQKGVIDHPELTKVASVLTYIDEDSNEDPLLILHGDRDRTVPFEQSVLLYNHCKKYDKDVTFYKVKNADHGKSVFYCQNTMDVLIQYLNSH